MSEPTCDFCGGLHYGSPIGYCSFRCPHCGGDTRPTEAVPDGFAWEHACKNAGRMVKQPPEGLMPETKVSIAEQLAAVIRGDRFNFPTWEGAAYETMVKALEALLAAEQRIAELETQIVFGPDELRGWDAFKRYGEHDADCAQELGADGCCLCGFSDVAIEAKRAEGMIGTATSLATLQREHAEMRERVVAAIPTNWCDSIMTGSESAFDPKADACRNVEAVLLAVKRRIVEMGLAPKEATDG